MTTDPPQRIQFGSTDLRVTRLCQGNAFRNIGRHVDNPAGEAVIHHCLDVGVNFFDTAIGYGEQSSAESALGQALAGRRDQAVICTKVSPNFPLQDSGDNALQAAFTRDFLLDRLDESLRRLQTDHVDLYLCHRPDEVTPPADLVESMTAVVQIGKARHWGLSNHTADYVEQCIACAATQGGIPPAGLEDYFNIAGAEKDRPDTTESRIPKYRREMFPVITRHNLGVLTFSPMDTGYLAPGRDNDPDSPINDLIQALDDAAAQLAVPRATLCAAWVASHDEVTAVIGGAESPQHVDQLLAGVHLQIPAVLLDKLNRAHQRYHETWVTRRRASS
ncbi:MAG: hypothetical protein CMJ49_08175 [Planctomycetaceae bacterium]|nr:hypothetical protein [Planctomycetaceae bacterium]